MSDSAIYCKGAAFKVPFLSHSIVEYLDRNGTSLGFFQPKSETVDMDEYLDPVWKKKKRPTIVKIGKIKKNGHMFSVAIFAVKNDMNIKRDMITMNYSGKAKWDDIVKAFDTEENPAGLDWDHLRENRPKIKSIDSPICDLLKSVVKETGWFFKTTARELTTKMNRQ